MSGSLLKQNPKYQLAPRICMCTCRGWKVEYRLLECLPRASCGIRSIRRFHLLPAPNVLLLLLLLLVFIQVERLSEEELQRLETVPGYVEGSPEAFFLSEGNPFVPTEFGLRADATDDVDANAAAIAAAAGGGPDAVGEAIRGLLPASIPALALETVPKEDWSRLLPPTLVLEGGGGPADGAGAVNVWHKMDRSYRVPKSSIAVKLWTPEPYASPMAAMQVTQSGRRGSGGGGGVRCLDGCGDDDVRERGARWRGRGKRRHAKCGPCCFLRSHPWRFIGSVDPLPLEGATVRSLVAQLFVPFWLRSGRSQARDGQISVDVCCEAA